MCQFKSGIICKSNITIAEGENDSHSDLLESLGIKDSDINAMKMFVRAELIPLDNEWWTNPISWKFIIDQDIVPDWFEMDKGKYEKLFRDAVLVWWRKHVLVNQKIDKLSEGYYRLKGCGVDRLCDNVVVWMDNSTIQKMYDNSIVREMHGGSVVRKMFDNSTIQEMDDNSTIQEMNDNSIVREMHGGSVVRKMFDNSTIQEMDDNSTIQEMNDNSTIQEMYDNSTVREMWQNSIVQAMGGGATIQKMYGNSIVREMYGGATIQKMYGNSIVRDFRNSMIRIIVPDDTYNNNNFTVIKHSDYK